MKITAKSRLHSRMNSYLMMLLIICLAGLLGWLSTRYSLEMDWTQTGRHSLSDASREVLARMPEQIEITAYARKEGNIRDAVKKIVGRYQRVKSDIVLHFVNHDAVPDEVRSLGITEPTELVARYQGRIENIKRFYNEETFSNALQRLARGAEHWLAFVEGHGERNPLGKANHDLGSWVQHLNNRGFRVQPINLANIRSVPENTHTLIIAGPQTNYLPGENALILEYIKRGGNLLWLLDPGDINGLEPVAETLSMQPQPGTIIDFAGRFIGLDDPTIVLITESMFPPHVVTNKFPYTVFFPSATAIQINANEDWQLKSLLSTGNHTWLETGELSGEVSFDEVADRRGPLDLGISLEREVEIENDDGEIFTRQQRMIVLGDGDFLSNTYLENSGNLELGIRIINWLSSDDDFISIPARIARDTNLQLSPIASGIIGFGFLIVLPLSLLSLGMTIWWRRRRL
jgi:ABC-type uncharacterized transport system involved in gliding motility auxiliary subunit